MSAPAAPSRPFRRRVAIQATLRDTDGVGHVNNAVHVSWIEEARTAYAFERRGLTDIGQLDFILASVQVDYRAPVLLHEVVDVWYAPSRIGAKSWEMVYEGRARRDGRLLFEARSTQVQYDYASARTVPIPATWRKLLEEDLLAPRDDRSDDGGHER